MGARLPFLGGLVLVAAACRELEPGHLYGTADVAWTIEGRTDPEACAEHDAKLVHVVVRDDDGTLFGDDWPSCRELSASYVLRRGWHHAALTLTDADHAPISDTRATSAFYVDGERDVTVVVDLTPTSIGPAAASEPD